MRGKVGHLLRLCLFDRHLVNDVFLCAVLHSGVAKAKWNVLIHYHTLGVRAAIHNVYLCDDTDCADALRIELASHLETVRVSHIDICRHDGENDGARVIAIPVAHVARDSLNVLWLIVDSDTCDARKINQGQIRTCVRVDLQDERLVNDVLFCSTHLVCEADDVVTDFCHLRKFPAGKLIREDAIRLRSLIHVVQAKLEGSARAHTIATW